MSEIITCPSGLSGRVRGMKVREERILTDRKLAKSGGQMEELLAACWVETLDRGVYDFGERSVDWSRVLQGDRFYALLKIREATYGPAYAFSVSCPVEACRTRIDWELDVNDLPVRPLSEESRAAFVAGNRFPMTLPDAGTRVWFKLFTGADERRLPALKKAAGDHFISAMLGMRLVEIQGVDAKDKRRFLEDLSMRDADALVDAFDRADCGVDTALEVECPECFGRAEVELPFDATFFLPGKERTARKRALSSSSPASR